MVHYEVHHDWATVEPFAELPEAVVRFNELLTEPAEAPEFRLVVIYECYESPSGIYEQVLKKVPIRSGSKVS